MYDMGLMIQVYTICICGIYSIYIYIYIYTHIYIIYICTNMCIFYIYLPIFDLLRLINI